MIQVLDQTAAFEHMYAPERAKALFTRHRDLTAICEREKQIIDFERHTVSHQLDKQKNKFKQRSGRLSKRLDELAVQPPLVDPSEFLEDDLNEPSSTSSKDTKLPLPGSPGRPKTASTPRTVSQKNATSVSMYDLSDIHNEIEPGENSITAPKNITKIRFSCHDAVIYPSRDELRTSRSSYAAMYPVRRGSMEFGKRAATEARIHHLKQSSRLQKIKLDAKVDTFVDDIEAYKARYKREIALKKKSEEDTVKQTKLNTKASVPLFNPFLPRQINITHGVNSDSRRENVDDVEGVEGQSKYTQKCETGNRGVVVSETRLAEPSDRQGKGDIHRRSSARKNEDADNGKINLSGLSRQLSSNDRDVKQIVKKRWQSAVVSSSKLRRDNQHTSTYRPKTAVHGINKDHFSLIMGKKSKKKPQPIPKPPETQEDIARTALLGAWEAFSSDANDSNFQHLVTFAAKHKAKKQTPGKQTITGKWRDLANQMVLSEKALLNFKGTLEKQQQIKLGLLPPADKEDPEAN